jgi:hypothetical protein
MWSNAPRSVRAVGAANRTVITITVMMVPITVAVRVRLAYSHSPMGADASGSIDAVDTGGCVARLSEHERAKCNHNGEHRRAISGDAHQSVLHLGTFGYRNAKISSLYMKTPAMTTGGFCPYSISRCREVHRFPFGDKSMRAQYATASKTCNKYRQINHQLANDVISRSMTLPRVLALLEVSPKRDELEIHPIRTANRVEQGDASSQGRCRPAGPESSARVVLTVSPERP